MRLALIIERKLARLRNFAVSWGLIVIGFSLTGCYIGGNREPGAGLPESNQFPLSFFKVSDSASNVSRFQAFAGSGVLFFTPGEIMLALDPEVPVSQAGRAIKPVSLLPVRLAFLGSDAEASLHGTNPGSYTANLIVGSDPSRWQLGRVGFSGLRYLDLYPGIDLTYGGQGGMASRFFSLKGTFFVAAGSDPAQIRWRYEGANGVRLETNGDLRIELPGSTGGSGRTLVEKAPLAWQVIAGRRVAVEAAFLVSEDGVVRFRLGEYNPALPLVIDPTIEFGTFLGGSGIDEPFGVAVDGARSLIVAGYTLSADFPSEIPLPEELVGTRNVFVTKLSRDGTQLEFSTILGGSGDDVARGVVVDSAGDIYLAGNTFSPDFPTVQPGQVPAEDTTGNIFIVKLSLSGGTIRYSTTYGGSGPDELVALAVDTGGSVVVGGFTSSEDFPLEAPVQPNFGGGERDGFVLRLNASGNQLIYSSYLGGSASDEVRGVAVDRRNGVYITGQTDSIDFPTASPMQRELGGLQDAFLTKLSPDMTGYDYSTYLGFGIASAGNDLLVDQDGNAYLVGTMERTEEEGRGGSDVFVLRMNGAGSGLDINIVLGGQGDDEGLGIGLDREQNVYVTGYTESADLANAGSFQAGYGGEGDAFLAQLNPAGELITYNYLGGSRFDSGTALEVIGSGDAAVAGVTFSDDFPVLNPQQRTLRGEGDIFIVKIEDVKFVPTPVPTATPGPTPLPPTATPVPTVLENIVESDNFLYALFGLMGVILLLMIFEVVRGGRRRR